MPDPENPTNQPDPALTPDPAIEPDPAPEPLDLDFGSLINADGSFKDGFFGALPEGLGDHSAIKTLTNVPDLAKAFINTKSMVGKKAEEWWTSEDPTVVTRRNEIMGIPQTAEEYNIEMPELPEGVPFDEAAAKGFSVKAKELGLTQAQTQGLINYDAERAEKAVGMVGEMMETRRAEAAVELKKEWGNQFDHNIAKIRQVTDHLGITEVLDSTGLGNEPAILHAILNKIAPSISDDALIEGGKTDNLATVNEALVELEGKMMEWTGSPRDPKYVAWVKERANLLTKAH